MNADLLLGRRLGDEVVDAGFLGDRRRGARVVAGDHHGLDAHPPELGEPLDEAFLDRVLELDETEDAALALEDQRRGAEVRDPVRLGATSGGRLPTFGGDRVDRALEQGDPGRRLDAARASLGLERDLLDDGPAEGREARVVADTGRAAELGETLAGQLDDRAPFRRLVADRGHEGGFDDLSLGARPAPAVMEAASRLP